MGSGKCPLCQGNPVSELLHRSGFILITVLERLRWGWITSLGSVNGASLHHSSRVKPEVDE